MEGSAQASPGATAPVAGGRRPRDLRADFFRGIALWFIFIDHIPDNRLGNLTLRNITLCDATEAFVLLAGYAGGIAYGAALEREGWLFAAAQVLRRVGTLYVAHIVLFVMFTAQVGYSAAAMDASIYIDELHLDAFGEQPYRALLEALLLRFQPAFLNILPLYILLLLQFALILPLIRRPRLLLGLSLILYAATRLLGLELPTWTGGGWFFNPGGWQLLFVIGVLIGHRAPDGAPGPLSFPWRRWAGGLALAWLVFAFALLFLAWHRPDLGQLAPRWFTGLLTDVDKTAMHPFRLVSILALTYLVAHWVPASAAWLRSGAAWPFLAMGQQGLPVFCSGILFSFMGRLALEYDDRVMMQLAVNAAGLASLVAVAWLSGWYKGKERARRASPAIPSGRPA
ncbi:OpgC family protein [Muricoccus aerilatus]|uniref:OpgC family protein n=1 Tax=Muricoccus aerilatus TaxID=452982 RepID=UPI00069464F0|nr:OpgC domain-containing protein [Roseomonas aerilata]